jgi:hypothetical protein
MAASEATNLRPGPHVEARVVRGGRRRGAGEGASSTWSMRNPQDRQTNVMTDFSELSHTVLPEEFNLVQRFASRILLLRRPILAMKLVPMAMATAKGPLVNQEKLFFVMTMNAKPFAKTI